MSKSVEELAHEIVDDCYVTNDWGNSAFDHVEFAKRIVSALSIQQEADAKDAARYRWLSAACNNWMVAPVSVSEFNTVSWETVHSSAELDAAIDAYRLATPTDSEEK